MRRLIVGVVVEVVLMKDVQRLPSNPRGLETFQGPAGSALLLIEQNAIT